MLDRLLRPARTLFAAAALAALAALAVPTGAALAEHGSDTFTIATRLTDSKFDPAFHFQEFDAVDILNIYEGLVAPVKGKPPTGLLASSWEASPDGTVWTFKLRNDVKFHDGKTLTAKDVVYSMDRFLTLGKGYSSLFKGILDVGNTKAIDDSTVQFTLNKPFGPFIETMVQFYVVNSELLKANQQPGDFGANGDYGVAYLQSHDAGSGPYRLDSFVPDRRRVLTAFADYRGGWKDDQFKRIVIEIVGETATARSLLTQGDVDFVDQWQPLDFYKNLKGQAGVHVDEDPDNKLYVVQMNTQKPPFDDVNFRKAVLYAFDYKTANDIILGGAIKANGPVPSAMPGHDGSIAGYTQDIAKAKEFLAKSKYKPGDYTLNWDYIKAGAHEEMALLLQANLKAVGIDMKITAEQWPTLSKNASKPDTAPHFFPVYNTAKYPTPDAYTFAMYHPVNHGQWQASAHYSNPSVSKLLEEARATPDAEMRNKKYADATKMIVDDAASLWVGYTIHRVALSDRVKNYENKGLMAYDLNIYNLRH